MKQALVLCGLFALVSSLDVDKWQRSEDGSEYLIQTKEEYNWYEAMHECARNNMSLLAMDTAQSYQQINKLLGKIFVDSVPRLWIAGHDNALQNRYAWITTGQPFYFTHWLKREPNNDNEHCISIWTKAVEWNDVACSRKFGYICEEMPLLKTKARELDELKKSYESQINQLKEELDSWKKFSLAQTNRTAATKSYNMVFRNN